MAGNGRNQVSLCKCMPYHSASRRSRRPHNRYLHISPPLAPITMIRIASAILRLQSGRFPVAGRPRRQGGKGRDSCLPTFSFFHRLPYHSCESSYWVQAAIRSRKAKTEISDDKTPVVCVNSKHLGPEIDSLGALTGGKVIAARSAGCAVLSSPRQDRLSPSMSLASLWMFSGPIRLKGVRSDGH